MRSRQSDRKEPASLAVLAFASVSALALLTAACKRENAAPAFDAAPPPVVTIDAAPTQLVPMDEDSGSTVDAAPPPAHHPTGGGLSTNQARAKQCCSALRAAGKTDPMLSAFAAQCDIVAMQMGPTSGGQAPEFAGLRNLLKGHNIPAVCSGL